VGVVARRGRHTNNASIYEFNSRSTKQPRNAFGCLRVYGITIHKCQWFPNCCCSTEVPRPSQEFLSKRERVFRGKMLNTQSARRAISASETSSIPASCARLRVASERPSRFVRTVQPAFVRLLATADPIAPAATIPMMGEDVADIIAGPARWYVLESDQSDGVIH